METSEMQYEPNGERERTAANSFIVRFWKFTKNKNFALLASRPQRPGMTSPLKKLLADCYKTFSGRPEDWTASGPCHLFSTLATTRGTRLKNTVVVLRNNRNSSLQGNFIHLETKRDTWTGKLWIQVFVKKMEVSYSRTTWRKTRATGWEPLLRWVRLRLLPSN